jgi:hypothetical protein
MAGADDEDSEDSEDSPSLLSTVTVTSEHKSFMGLGSSLGDRRICIVSLSPWID